VIFGLVGTEVTRTVTGLRVNEKVPLPIVTETTAAYADVIGI